MINRYKQSTGLAALTALLLANPATAVADEAYTESDLFGEIPVVSAVSRFEQRLEQAPASVTIISRELIELSGAQTVVDIFRLVPGFQAYYVGGNRYGISYHGIGREFPNQIEVMVDGRSVYETLFSSVNWSTLGIGLADIDHIEVVRGSNAAAQGSNAFLGAINIITRKPVQDGGLSLEATAGNWMTRNAGLRYSGELNEINYRVALGYEKNDGFPAVEDGPLEDGRELVYGNFRATLTPTLVDTLDLALGYADDRIGWGDSDHPDAFSPADSSSSFQFLSWIHNPSLRHEVQVDAYHNKFKTRNFSDGGPVYGLLGLDDQTAQFLTAVLPPPADIVALFSQLSGLEPTVATAVIEELNTTVYGGYGELASERYDIQVQHKFTPSDTFRGTWGVGSRFDSLETYHPQAYSQDIDESSFRFFIHSEWQPAERWTFNAGTMVEDSHVGTLISPRVSANYQLSRQHAFRVAYARGNRAPSLLEAHEDSVSKAGDIVYDILRIADPAMHEETVDTYELAYMLKGSNDKLNLDIRAFREEVSDVIDESREPSPPETQVFGDRTFKRLMNKDYWQFTGGEVQLNYRVTPSTFLRLHYTNVDFDTDIALPRFEQFDPFSKDDRVARHSGGILINQQFGDGWSASLMAYHQSELRWEDGDDFDSITRVDANISYKFMLGATHGSVQLVAQNLGSDYSEFNDNNIFQTRYFLTVKLDFPE